MKRQDKIIDGIKTHIITVYLLYTCKHTIMTNIYVNVLNIYYSAIPLGVLHLRIKSFEIE